jgi:hypothetical protein
VIDSETILRVARLTDRIEEVVRLYTEGLGLSWLEAFEDHEGFDGVMLGVPGAGYHIEITRKRGYRVGATPTEDDLLPMGVRPASVHQAGRARRPRRHADVDMNPR